MRQIHHWAALLFLAAIVVHLARVFFTGAFRRPREINWIIGVTMLILAIVNGFAGYSLLDDQLSGTGLRIAYSIALSIPVIGTWIASLLFGGEFPGPDIISRLYVIHILLVPALIAVLLSAHLGPRRAPQAHAVRRAGPDARTTSSASACGRPTRPRPSGLFFLTAAVLCLLGGLVQINPIWLFGPFNPAEVSAAVPARLVHGLARRRAAHHARLGDPGVRLRDPEPVLPRRAAGRRSRSRCCTCGRSSKRG